MDEFLKVEYEQCLSLLKYYDERHQSLVNFAAGLSSAVPSLLLGFYGLGKETAPNFWSFAALISGMTMLSLSAIFTSLIQNRLYFVYPARQVNAIRKASFAALGEKSEKFDCNQMYTDTSFNAFKLTSTHSLLNGFVALQIGTFAGLLFFSLLTGRLGRGALITWAALICIATAVSVFVVSAVYLHVRSKSHPDVSIHRGG